MNPIVRSGAAARTGALLILLGPLVSWVAKFITAAAWQDPPYSALHNWVSHLGLTGPPQTAFGQVVNSPLGAVMDTGWVIYGTLLIVGAFLVFDPRKGTRPIIIMVLAVLAVLAGVGVSLVGIFQGSNTNVDNGLIAFHTSARRASCSPATPWGSPSEPAEPASLSPGAGRSRAPRSAPPD
ncbi:DUF998 domain-containing protein [Streptomyces sp. RLB1-33]|nr:DUF998 domain-containing protein [Streptomyces sp. RLB1-33]